MARTKKTWYKKETPVIRDYKYVYIKIKIKI